MMSITLMLEAITIFLLGNFPDEPVKMTANIYLAKPVYIYQIKSDLIVLDGYLGSDLDSMLTKQNIESKIINQTFYFFEVVEVLKGKNKENITLSFYTKNGSSSCDLSNDFNGHADEEFWYTSAGRSFMVNEPQTHLIHSCFELGKHYLIMNPYFLKNKAYELISTDDDLWLKTVKEIIK